MFKKVRALIIAIFLPISCLAFNYDFIRVRLLKNEKFLRLDGIGMSYSGQDQIQKIAIPQNKSIEVRFQNQEFQIIDQGRTLDLKYPVLLIRGENILANGKEVSTQLALIKNHEGFDVISILPMETYLLGVVRAEVPSSWPLETLKAQTIVARSYAMAMIRQRYKLPFHVESSVLDQAFRQIAQSEKANKNLASVFKAVESTRGIFLKDLQNMPVKAYFHADCGGQTTNAKDVWGGDSTDVVNDSFCANSEHSHWSYYITKKQTEKILRESFKKPLPGVLENIVLQKSGLRVTKVKFIFKGEGELTISSDHLRSILGYNLVKSTNFSLETSEVGFRLQGRGFGHGVGFCQTGSRALGLHGKNYQEILAHYYPKASLAQTESRLASTAL